VLFQDQLRHFTPPSSDRFFLSEVWIAERCKVRVTTATSIREGVETIEDFGAGFECWARIPECQLVPMADPFGRMRKVNQLVAELADNLFVRQTA
jgi:hypothetical protein